PRVKFKNLKEIKLLNHIDTMSNAPWLPSYEYRGGGYSSCEVDTRYELLTVERRSDALPDNTENVGEDAIYQGSDNPLILEQYNTVEFSCQFDLAQYPFDSQLCILSLIMRGVTKDFVSLRRGLDLEGITFQGQSRLM
ncbi:unnamed protein product, partial [Meganyctiphanes norvegica]